MSDTEMRASIKGVLKDGPKTAPQIARSLYPDAPSYTIMAQASKIRHHMYKMERDEGKLICHP